MTRRSLLVAIGLALALLAAPPRPAVAAAPPLTVLAASSLTETLQRVATAWTAKGNPAVTLSFDASSKLAKQIEAGVPADAFVSADAAWMDYLGAKGLVDATTRADIVGNRLVAVVSAAGRIPVEAAADLAKPEIAHLALGGENVPVGKYARAALLQLGVWEGVQGRVVNGDNVRTVLGWVADGEAEAGVVYATDARVEPRVHVAFSFPASSHPPIVYPAAVTRSSTNPAAAASFLTFCRSAEGMAVFTAAGFTPAPVAR